jgi:integrase
MASIERRRRKDGKVSYRVKYRDPDGVQQSETFRRRADAETFLVSVEADIRRGHYIRPQSGDRPFEEVASEWRATRLHRATTKDQVDSHFKNHILPFFRGMPIGIRRPSIIQRFVNDLSTRVAPSTHVIYGHVAAIFRYAVQEGLIAESPCRDIRLPKRERAEIILPEIDEVLAITAALPDRYRALITTNAGTGLRPGEGFGLAQDRVRLDEQWLTVDQQVLVVTGRAPFLGPPKTDNSFWRVPIPTVVVDALRRHMQDYPRGPHGLLFTDHHGRMINRQRFSEVWRKAIRDAGVRPTIRFHDLRHFYASMLIRHGESVKTVQARLGHGSATETLDRYGHLWPDSEDRTRAAVDAAFGGSGALTEGTPA